MRKKDNNRILIERDRALINRALAKYLRKLKGPRALRRAMEYAVLAGGKRLRPVLTLESARALRGEREKALPFACAIEFVHAFSLIHDDLPAMDNDDTRRGKPACHKKFGEALAILAGDGLLNLAFGTICKLKRKSATRALRVLSRAIGEQNMIGGQALDIGMAKATGKKSAKLENEINNMKTASLISASCEIGALTAKTGAKNTERMRAFGRNLGLAFQLADDMEDAALKSASLEKMRKRAEAFISKSKKYLAPFKEKANPLLYIADLVLSKAKTPAIKEK